MWNQHDYTAVLMFMLLFFEPISYSDAVCAFDQNKRLNPPVKKPGRSLHASHRLRRTSNERTFDPLRIRVDFYDFEASDTESLNLLKRVFKNTVRTAEAIFEVERDSSEAALLLPRTACASTHVSGINSGKCAAVKPSYSGENCIDDFQIPEDHLEGLAVYEQSNPEPQILRADGAGVPDTDLVVYVRSRYTQQCRDETRSIRAYASYCHLASNNRPISGYINMCPGFLQGDDVDEHTVYLTALHELFHVLGFSKDLFGKFLDCSSSNGCVTRSAEETVGELISAHRLITPSAVEATSEHFNCSTHPIINQFGPILQRLNNVTSSHWDGAFMYSSIMAPVIGLPFETVIDKITLAYFEDTGWYRVNYSYAENFPWGKGGGCDWGLFPQCRTKADGDCFCANEGEMGCHYLRKSKGVCNNDLYLGECQAFKSNNQLDSCLFADNSPADASLQVSGEFYGQHSRCFLSNLTTTSNANTAGRCYETRCNGTDLEVRVGSSPWTACPYDHTIQVDGFTGVLQCPSAGVLCVPEPLSIRYRFDIEDNSSSTVTYDVSVHALTSPRPSYPPEDETRDRTLELHFLSADYDVLVARRLTDDFVQECVLEILRSTELARHRVKNWSLRSGSVVFQFRLAPAQQSSEGPPSHIVVGLLEEVIGRQEFTVHLSQAGVTYTADSVIVLAESPGVSDSGTPTEVIVGAVVGSLIVAVGLGVAVYFVQRYYTRQSLRQSAMRSYRQRHQHSLTSDTTTTAASDSRHSSQSRASARSQQRSRSNSSNQLGSATGFTFSATEIDLDVDGPSQIPAANQGLATPTSSSQNSITLLGASQHELAIGHDILPAQPMEISYDYRSERQTDGGNGPPSQGSSKSSSRQRTPVSGKRKSRRRSSCGVSTTSRTSSGDRQTATGSTNSSSQGRRRRSRSRSSLKLKNINDQLCRAPPPSAAAADDQRPPQHNVTAPGVDRPPRNVTTGGAYDRPPRYHLRKSKSSGRTNEAFEIDDDALGIRRAFPHQSPSTRRQGYKKSLSAEQTNSGGDKPKMRRPRQQRRKTTQCVFSPRDEMQPINFDVSTVYSAKGILRDKTSTSAQHQPQQSQPHPAASNAYNSPAEPKCLDTNAVTSSQCQQQTSSCPLQGLSKRKYETSTCPLQTPNCSKEDIKESDLPTPPLIINPRDSDLSFTVDLNDIDVIDSLSVFCAPRVDLMTMNGPVVEAASESDDEFSRDITPLDTPTTPTPGTPLAMTPTPDRHVTSSASTSSLQPTAVAVVRSNHQDTKPTVSFSIPASSFIPPIPQPPSIYNNYYQPPFSGNGLGTPQHYNGYASRSSIVEKPFASAPPRVEHLEQLPLMVPVFKLTTRDYDVMQRTSGSWRSFSSDTSLDSMSSPV